MSSGGLEDDIQLVHEFLDVSFEDIKPLVSVNGFAVFISAIKTKVKDINALKDQLVLQEVNHEHKENVLTKKINFLEQQLQSSNNQAEESRNLISVLRNENESLKTNLENQNKRFDALTTENQSLRRANSELQEQSKIASEQLSIAKDQIEALQNENSHLGEQVQSAHQALSDIEERKKQHMFASSSSRVKEEILVQEKSALVSDLASLQSDHSKVCEKLEVSSRQVQDLEKKLAGLAQQNTELNEKIQLFEQKRSNYSSDGNISKILETDPTSIKELEEEVETQKRLTALWESKSSELQSEVAALQEKLTSQQSLYNNVTEELNNNKQQLLISENSLRELQEKYDSVVSELQVVKENKNTSVSAGVGLFSPLAQKLSAVQNPEFSFTKVYSDNMKLQQKVSSLKLQLDRLTNKFSSFCEQVKQRIPVVKQQRSEIVRNNIYMNFLSESLETSNNNLTKVQAELLSTKMRQEACYLQLTASRTQCSDLSREVICLMAELDHLNETKSRNVPATVQVALDEYAQNPSTASETLVNKELANFSSIKEAVSKTLELREKVRALECDVEIQKQTVQYQISNAVKENSNTLSEQIKNLESELNSSKIKNESLLNERNLLKEMLATSRSSILSHNSSAGNIDDKMKSIDESTRELEKNYEVYRNEMTAIQESLSKRNQDLLSEMEAIRKELENSKYQQQLSTDRLTNANNDVEAFKKEAKELRSINQNLQDIISRQDQRASKFAEELLHVNSLAERLKGELNASKGEKDLRKRTQERLISENDKLLAERERLMSLVSDLQTFLNQQQLSDAARKVKFESEKESLSLSLQKLKESNEKMSNDLHSLQKSLEKSGIEYSSRIKTLMLEKQSLSEDNRKLLDNQQMMEIKLQELNGVIELEKQRFSTLEAKFTQQKNTSYSEREALLESSLSDLQSKHTSLESQYNYSLRNIEQLQAASKLAEEMVERVKTEYDEYRLQTSESLEKNHLKITSLEQRIVILQDEIASSSLRCENITKDSETRVALLLEENKHLNNELSSHRNAEKQHLEKENDYKQQLLLVTEDLRKTREDYEKELLRHADARSTLQKLREDYTKALEQVEDLNKEIALKAGINESQPFPISEKEDPLRQEVYVLKKQNAMLLTQLQSSNLNFAEITSPSPDLDSVMKLGLSDLQNHVKRISKEMEIISCQRQLLFLENKKLKRTVESSNRVIADLQRGITEKDVSSTSESVGERSNYLNMVALLNESNKSLRENLERNEEVITELREKIETLKTDLANFRLNKEQLESQLQTEKAAVKKLENSNEEYKRHNQEILLSLNSSTSTSSDASRLKNELVSKENLIEELNQEIGHLKSELETVKSKSEDLENERAQNQSKIEQLELKNTKLAAAWRTKYEQVVNKSLEKHNQIRQQLSQKTSELEAKVAECHQLNEQLNKPSATPTATTQSEPSTVSLEEFNSTKEELSSTQRKLSEIMDILNTTKEELEKVRQNSNKSEGTSKDTEIPNEEEMERKKVMQQEVLRLRSRIAKELQKNELLRKQNQVLQDQVKALQETVVSSEEAESASVHADTKDLENLKKTEEMLSVTFQVIFNESISDFSTSTADFTTFVQKEWEKRREILQKDVEEQVAQSHQKQLDNIRKELEMRNKLKLSMLEKNLARVRAELEQSKKKDSPAILSLEASKNTDSNKSNSEVPAAQVKEKKLIAKTHSVDTNSPPKRSSSDAGMDVSNDVKKAK
ncbi:Medial ring protein Alm1 [Schizosaccharomyces pombe]|uniref:Nucleoporin alm1 n=1 Tax=Schizosaccharomyces pombe (strain 972 / ATCC 24843) TaxID=284812 RepID=ALM1_SCHPO|nr:medial ring protein Alm1 [Schizosaccharomyces pombe]Q9UTK5.1 RecName: Full=Nucleoporin alm1; AltName: Full=Abnormal long morphology protein 1; AltName: Full=Sp8 [Schizosaccharomyces pombe 972h-]CAB62414.1 medial ring protein Alm1 [Schizosaccharomyces pombe]|eukprot:NP_594092.1 medial ring protein Alm1 [Schizosaccharomyces pombe]